MKRKKIHGKNLSEKHGVTVLFPQKLLKKKLKKGKYSLTNQQKQEFVLLLSDLLINGFTLQESLTFMEKLLKDQQPVIRQVSKRLARGVPLYESFERIGFSQIIVAQLSMADIHGDLSGTLIKISQEMKELGEKKQALLKILSYPLLLLFFLLMMLLGMKNLLLPQLRQIGGSGWGRGFAFQIIEYGPIAVTIVFGVVCSVSLFMRIYFRKKSAVFRCECLMRIPLFRKFYQSYLTSFFSFEWGKLLHQGIEMRQVFKMMKKDGSTPLMKELALVLESSLENGENAASKISQWSFFLTDLSTIIRQGEAKGKLGEELIIYSTRLRKQMLQKADNWLQWLQPLLFLFIAVLIVCLYGALLLPMYKGVENIL